MVYLSVVGWSLGYVDGHIFSKMYTWDESVLSQGTAIRGNLFGCI